MSKENDELRTYLETNWHKLPLRAQVVICLYITWKVFLHGLSTELQRVRGVTSQGKFHELFFGRRV
jgi:hypothetical protein